MTTPYAQYTDSTEIIGNYFLTQLQGQAATLGMPAQNSVFYGDQDLLPVTPAVCVVPGPENSQYNGVGGRPVMMTFETYMLVYYDKVQDVQQNLHGCLQLANKIKHFFNNDPYLGGFPNGLVIDQFCSAVEPGVAVRSVGQGGRTLLMAARMAFRSRSKVALQFMTS